MSLSLTNSYVKPRLLSGSPPKRRRLLGKVADDSFESACQNLQPRCKKRRLDQTQQCLNSSLCRDDPYAILGIGQGAPLAEVRKAYVSCALSSHPDKGGSVNEFHHVVKAFESLSVEAPPATSMDPGVGFTRPARSSARALLVSLVRAPLSLWQAQLTGLRVAVLEALATLLENQQCRQGAIGKHTEVTKEVSGVSTSDLASPDTISCNIFRTKKGYCVKVGWHGFYCKTNTTSCLKQALAWHMLLVHMRCVAIARLAGSSTTPTETASAAQTAVLLHSEVLEALDKEQPCTRSPLKLGFYSDIIRGGKRLSSPWTSDLEDALQYRQQLEALAAAGASVQQIRKVQAQMQGEARMKVKVLESLLKDLTTCVRAELAQRRRWVRHGRVEIGRTSPPHPIRSSQLSVDGLSCPGGMTCSEEVIAMAGLDDPNECVVTLPHQPESRPLQAPQEFTLFGRCNCKSLNESALGAPSEMSRNFTQYLEVDDLCRTGTASMGTLLFSKEEMWIRLEHFVYRRDFFASRRSRAGRLYALSHTEQASRLHAFLQSNRLCFVCLDLSQVPIMGLEHPKMRQLLARMPHLTRIHYPTSGWTHIGALRHFEAAIPEGIVREAVEVTTDTRLVYGETI